VRLKATMPAVSCIESSLPVLLSISQQSERDGSPHKFFYLLIDVPEPSPDGTTLTRPSGVTSTRPGGLELYLVPATTTSTATRWCDLDPARPGVLDATTLSTAAYLDDAAAYGSGLVKGSKARESGV
jgi:hypothetical protein